MIRVSLQGLWSVLGYPDVSLASRSKQSWSKVIGALKGICAMEPGLPRWGKVYSLGERWSGKPSRRKWHTRLCTFIWLSKLEIPLIIIPKKGQKLACRLWNWRCLVCWIWGGIVQWTSGHYDLGPGKRNEFERDLEISPGMGRVSRGPQEGSSLMREHEEWKGG